MSEQVVNRKLTQLAARMLRDIVSDDRKVLAMALIAPAVLRAMQYAPPGEPTLSKLRNVMLDAAAGLEKV